MYTKFKRHKQKVLKVSYNFKTPSEKNPFKNKDKNTLLVDNAKTLTNNKFDLCKKYSHKWLRNRQNVL